MKIGYEAAFNALLSAQMDGSNVELTQAALDKARAGVEAALEMDGLDAGIRETLEGLIENIDSGERIEDNQTKRRGIVLLNNGYFQIIDWTGYPEGERPDGPFIILEGENYNAARDEANSTNAQLHRQNSSLKGLQIHEVHPVKFGGSPTELSNKVFLTLKEHAKFTVWWNRLLKEMKE